MTDTSDSELDILVVDDDRPIRGLVRQIIRRIGYPSREAVDGEDAIEKLTERAPDLLVLDLMMPRVSGWDVLEWMEKESNLRTVPVVVLTAVGTEQTEALEAFNVRAVVPKPFEISSLMETLREIIE